MRYQQSFAIFLFILLLTSLDSKAQKFLQIEIPNQVETVRYKVGDKLKYRTQGSGKEWQSGRIKSILVDENVIIFENEFVHLDQISHIKERIQSRYIAGGILGAFGAGWLLYGGIALLFKLPNVMAKDLIVGVVALAAGWVFQKFSTKTYSIGKNARLRLIDITFPLPAKP